MSPMEHRPSRLKKGLVVPVPKGYIICMKTLAKYNPYLRNTEQRQRMVSDSVRESSIFEGAKCFHSSNSRKRASTHAPKKAASGA
jgi:hypothetical protein